MRKLLISLLIILTLGLALGTEAYPAQADCSQVDFYVTSTLPEEIWYDIANWSTADRVIDYLSDGEEHRFSLPPGSYEFYFTSWDGDWYLGEWVYLPACSRAAAYVKLVNGQPVLKVKVFLPQTG